MFKNKKAFTLAEMLMVFVIMGVIASIGITIVKPWDRAYKYSYTRVYDALSVTIYNYMTATAGVDSFPSTPTKFCNALLEYMNTSNNAKGGSSNPCNLDTGKNAFLGNNPESDVFNDKKSTYINPKITLSNGAKLWIGSNNGAPYTYKLYLDENNKIDSTKNASNLQETLQYYLVYVDLNGDRGPNTTLTTTRRLADVVAFAVTDRFIVLPLGYPKYDQRYLSAHIIYPYTEENEETMSSDGGYPSESMTYYEALVGAYGRLDKKIVTVGIPQTYELEEGLPTNNLYRVIKDSNEDKTYYSSGYHPAFDQDLCGDGVKISDIIKKGRDSHCEIKIYNYN